ncbi:trigger factor [Novosphingobium sp. FGD1]|uniref:Trigger factor n=1 Tax=Novosphingobium silvae TaxID=2692619 RepID=A0A7X4GGW9_9SPHN|nr:trigger factor [Novosphingobium silvae]MYL97364.1 trigger factor [Novosphingobium silvae]
MQIVETTNEGLKRAYTVTIPAAAITSKIEGEVKKIAPQVRMPGFRAGKVPVNLVKKLHGPAIHQEALNTSIREAMDKLVADQALRPAMNPDVSLAEGYEEGKDAELTVSLEILPKIEAPSLDGLKLEKLTVPVSDDAVTEAVERIATQQQRYEAKEGEAADGDQVIIDFTGKLDGVEFEGGKAEKAPLVIGAGRFIPGFEEQLTGAKAGDERTITVTFPEDYPAENLAGKETTFDIVVHEVKAPAKSKIDDDFAKELGLESLEQLTGLLRGQLEQETAGLTRTAMKRSLLDQLAAGHDFEVPPTMVEAEFSQIWQQLVQEAQGEEDPAAALEEIEAEKDDYRKIAERRVRLGLLLSEIGQANGVEVTAQEMQMLVSQAAQQYRPEDRQRFFEYVQQDPMMAAQLRAPLYEDKVVDFLIEKADVTEREVTREELQAAIEADTDGADAEKPAAKKAPAKKAKKAEDAAEDVSADAGEDAPKKAAAKKAAKSSEDAAEGEREPAKKAPAKKAAAKSSEDAVEGEAEAEAEAKPAKKAPAKKKAADKEA